MARATFVKKARNDIPSAGIKAGESYYWWKFRHSGKHYSKTPPRRSQLTQSNFYATVWDIEDEIGALAADDGLESACEDIASRLREAGEECQSSFDNMPEGLQQGETGQLLEERVQAMEAAADEFEGIEFDAPDPDNVDDEDLDLPERAEGESDEDFKTRSDAARDEAVERLVADYWQEKLDEIQAVSIDAP